MRIRVGSAVLVLAGARERAAVAVAHSILVICWHLLTHDSDYDDLGGDYFTERVCIMASVGVSVPRMHTGHLVH